jgi:hypothetical protein
MAGFLCPEWALATRGKKLTIEIPAAPADLTPEGDEGEDLTEDIEPGEEALGDPGKRALDAMKAKEKASREKVRTLAEENRALKAAAATPVDPADAEAVRAEIRAEERARSDAQLVKSEVRAVASSILTDPAIAVKLLDLSLFSVADDGSVDADEIREAISDLVEEMPYLAHNFAAQSGGKKRVPSVPGAPAGNSHTPATLDDQIAAAIAAGQIETVIALKQHRAAALKKG